MNIQVDKMNSTCRLQLIEESLASVCRTIDEHLVGQSKTCEKLIRHYQSRRGKMIRPRLLLLSAGACGQIKKEHILSAAIFQLIHDATLLHDDVIDHGLIRRNIFTVNSFWGNKCAILLGDVFLSHAFKISSSMGQKIIDKIAETTLKICEGEIAQDLNSKNGPINENEYLQIVRMKSATMFGSCCYLGAFLCEAQFEICKNLERYGIFTGMAYQISDDIADICNDDIQLGKSSARDIRNHTITLPFIHLFQQGYDYEEAISLDKSELVGLLNETGSLSYCRERIKMYCTHALKELCCLQDNEFKSALSSITESILLRAITDNS
jgi:octaprenyl-diphosphate synthase